MEVNAAGRESRHVVDENVVSHKKCGTRWKLSLESSGLTHKRDGDGEVNEVPNDHILLSNCKKQMEIEEARKESKGMNDDYIRSRDKLCGSRRKLSLETFDQFQKGDGNDKVNLVPNCSLSPKAQEPSVTSSRSSLLKAGNLYDNQEQDSKSVNDGINMISKKLTVGKKQPLGSSEACQRSDGCNEAMIVNACKSDSNASHEASPILPVVNSIEPLHKDFINKMENSYSDLNCKRLCYVGKKLALGFRGSSQTQEKDDKENVVPVHKKPLPQPKSPSMGSSMSSFMSKVGEFYERESDISGLDVSHKKSRIGRKLSLGPLAQLQRSNDDSQLLVSHSQKLSEDPSNALHMQQDCRWDDKQKSNYDNSIKIDEGSKRQKTDGSPMSELVIVLDSEDSEDEENVSLRSKSLLARKRIGKWRAKA
jgi:ubiquitin-conjugating enzyme E2 T